MASDDIGNLLNAGIQAAKVGNKAEARRLLEQVLERDDNNEVAWMWFASVVDTPRERRICLENVLEINPSNQQARQALERLGPRPATGPLSNQPKSESTSAARPISSSRNPTAQPRPPGAASMQSAASAPVSAPAVARPARPAGNRRRRPISPAFLIGGMALAAVLIIVGLLMASNTVSLVQPTETSTVAARTTGTKGVAVAPTATPILPTLTPVNATFVNITATPMLTFTPLPTNTSSSSLPTPTLTLANYAFYFVGEGRGRSALGIYSLNGDGTGEKLVVQGDAMASDVSFGSNGKIVYVTQVDGKDQVATANIDGSNPVILTNAPGAHLHTPVWSPDGKRIAFVSDESGKGQVLIMPADGRNPARATSDTFETRDPAWSPDGTELIYVGDPIGKQSFQPYVLDLATGKSAPLFTSGGSTTRPVWSPDGKQIAFVSTRDRYPNIYVMNLADMAPRLVSLGSGTATNRDPAWSPDGQYIVFASDRNGGVFNLFVASPDGKNIRQITRSKDSSYGAQFRPGTS